MVRTELGSDCLLFVFSDISNVRIGDKFSLRIVCGGFLTKECTGSISWYTSLNDIICPAFVSLETIRTDAWWCKGTKREQGTVSFMARKALIVCLCLFFRIPLFDTTASEVFLLFIQSSLQMFCVIHGSGFSHGQRRLGDMNLFKTLGDQNGGFYRKPENTTLVDSIIICLSIKDAALCSILVTFLLRTVF